jgi:hypothetical protein
MFNHDTGGVLAQLHYAPARGMRDIYIYLEQFVIYERD